MMYKTTILACLIVMVFLPIAGLQANEKSGERIDWQVISSGGTAGVSVNYGLYGTAGQMVVGAGSSENFGIAHGFWEEISEAGNCCVIRGDINHDGGGPDISDLVYLVSYMFSGGPEPPCNTPYYMEADINGDTTGPDISDLVYVVTYMFSGGPAPVSCP
ncbi:MAG TPA: hypothetical protein PLF13_04225 [candidate division Zixibacteria bacterium]|nr:hypothetical protein [candidate division Zixibacteria bacterium]